MPSRCVVRSKLPLVAHARSGASHFFSTAASAECTLYQYATCPFCNIVKSVLRYSKTPYQAVEVNPLTKAEIKWSEEYRKVPIASLGNKHFFGSDNIVKGLLDKLDNTNTQKVPFSEESTEWTKYATDELAPLLYPNLCNSILNSYRAFDYVHQVNSFSTVQRYSIQYIGSLAMYFAASKIKKKRGIDDERKALMNALNVLEDSLQDDTFLIPKSHGAPDMADLYVYGVLRGLEGLAVHDKVMSDYKRIPLWYRKMRGIVEMDFESDE
eukprot:scaffold2306_cov132-Cylindrotheca_fusiformis.AAC.5